MTFLNINELADIPKSLSIHSQFAFTIQCTDMYFCVWLLFHHLTISHFLCTYNHKAFCQFQVQMKCNYNKSDIPNDTPWIFFFKRQKYTRHWWYCITAWQNAQWDKHHTAPLKRNHGDGKADKGWTGNKWTVVTVTSSAALLQGLLLCLPATCPIRWKTDFYVNRSS